MNCREARDLVDAYADDELDIVTARQFDWHLRQCDRCSQTFEGVLAAKSAASDPALYYPAPPGLRDEMLALVRCADAGTDGRAAAPGPRGPLVVWRSLAWRLLALAASLLIAATLVWLIFALIGGRAMQDIEARDVLNAHFRSLLADNLIGVKSTDQHTVKPWLDRQLDFAPPVPNLSADGFELIGGRIDYAHDRPISAAVYRRGLHIINLYAWPGDGGGDATLTTRGVNLVRWTADSLTFWAVSDLNRPELQRFAQLVRAAAHH